MKIGLCKDCGINSKYSVNDKTYSYCRDCQNLRNKSYGNSERGRASKKKYAESNRGKEIRDRYFKSEKGKKVLRANNRRRRTYFTPELFNESLISQNYMCAICNKDIHESSHADHDHVTKMPRGILCPGCNTLLGRLESVGFEWVDAAKLYLQKYS